LPGFTQKESTIRKKTPGQHGTEINMDSEASSFSNYGRRLMEKQKLRYNYGISENQLLSYVNRAKRKRGSTGILLLQMLELRLDNIIYKLGLAPTIQASRQMVSHGHILVNKKKVNIPSFQCTIGDEVTLNPKSKFFEKIGLSPIDCPKYLEKIQNKTRSKCLGIIKQIPERNDVSLVINELFVIEYYSR
jgi:small subunit ribosomal protein S4